MLKMQGNYLIFREMKFGILVILLLIGTHTFAQKNINQRLNQWNIYCDKLKGIPDGEENFPALIKAAIKGVKMTPSTNFLYKSIFYFHLGGGYESTYKIDSAISYYEISKKYAEKAQNNSRIVLALRRLSGLYDNKQWLKKANDARNQLMEIASVDKDQEIQIGANIVLGEYYFNAGLFEKALQSYIQYIKYLKLDYAKTANSSSKANIGVGYLAVGEIYQNLNQKDKSLPYFKESIHYLENYQEGLETAFKDLVTSYLSLKEVDSALHYYHRLKKSALKSGDYTILIDAQVALARDFISKHKLTEATKLLYEADKNLTISKEKEDFALVKNAMGDLFLKRGNSRLAIRYYKQALPLALYFKDKALIANLYQNLAGAEKNEKLLDDAYEHALLYAVYTDSLKRESISKNIIEMEARYQNEVKQQQIGLLNQENKQKNTQLSQERKIKWILITTALIALLAVGLIYLIYKNKQKANLLLDQKNRELDAINSELDRANQTKAKLFSIISHDLRSPVSQLFTFLKLQQNAAFNNEEEKIKHQEMLLQSSKNLLSGMEDLLLWSKSQMDHFEVDLFRLEVTELFEQSIAVMMAQAEAKNIRIDVGETALRTITSDENLLLIIIRNLLQNAINHANPDSIILLTSGLSVENQNYIAVINEGVEISQEKIDQLLNYTNIQSKSSGYGLLIVKELAQKLNAKLEISSNSKKTIVTLIFY